MAEAVLRLELIAGQGMVRLGHVQRLELSAPHCGFS